MKIQQFRSNLVVTAIQYTEDNVQDIIKIVPGNISVSLDLFDWVVWYGDGKPFICKPEIFEQTYQEYNCPHMYWYFKGDGSGRTYCREYDYETTYMDPMGS